MLVVNVLEATIGRATAEIDIGSRVDFIGLHLRVVENIFRVELRHLLALERVLGLVSPEREE